MPVWLWTRTPLRSRDSSALPFNPRRIADAEGDSRIAVLLYNSLMEIDDLPGNELILAGIEDLRRGTESVPALLVSIGAPRLRSLGFPIPNQTFLHPEYRLYELLRREDPDAAHSRYNALVNRLVSFERAAECAT